MNTGGTPRRTLLQRGLALLAGGVALATGSRVIRADSRMGPKPEEGPDPQPPRTTLTLYSRQRPLPPPPGAPRSAQEDLARHLSAGDLLDAQGNRVGIVHTNCFCPGAPFGAQRSASDLEFQVMQLENGTLFGMCGGARDRGEKVRAIVGGTGRYAGARGAYLERPSAADADVVEFVVTLAG